MKALIAKVRHRSGRQAPENIRSGGSFTTSTRCSRIPTSGGSPFPKRCARARTSRSIISSLRILKRNMSPMFRSRICLPDTSGDPVRHPQVDEIFVRAEDGAYQIKTARRN